MPSLTLVTAASFGAAWNEHLGPWFAETGARAWKSQLPSAIVAPNHASAMQLRRLMQDMGVPIFNVRLWSVDDLGKYLAEKLSIGPAIIEPVDLTLLARSVAESLHNEYPSDQAIETLARVPAPLIEVLNTLESGGWDLSQLEGSAFRKVAARLKDALSAAGMATQAQRRFELEAKSRGRAPLIESLLLAGFDASHFALWPVLKASVTLCKQAMVVTSLMGPRAEDFEMTWMGSWEQLGAEVVGDGDPEVPPLTALAEAYDEPTVAGGSFPDAHVQFGFSRDDASQAQAIARRVVESLEQGQKPVCVLVPEEGPLAREVSLILSSHEIAHYCSIAPVIVAEEERAWHALLDAINTPDAVHLARLCACHAFPKQMTEATPGQLSQAILRTVDDLLLQALPAVGAALSKSPRDLDRPAAQVVNSWPTLPLTAPLSKLIEETGNLAERVGLSGLSVRLRLASVRLGNLVTMIISRDSFCEWARAVLSDPRNAAPAASANPLAPVQILRAREAVLSRWSHVVMAGQNEGISPAPIRQGGLFSEEAIEQLNAQVRVLNRSATDRGDSGEGHVCVQDGKALCLSALSRRNLEMRDLLRVIACTDRLTLMASLRDPAGSQLQPGPIIARIHYLVRGESLGFEKAARQSRAEVLRVPALEPIPAAAEQVLRAFAARRDPAGTPGIYDFSMDGAATPHVRITASQWARVMSTPAIQWLRSYVGVGITRRTEGSPWGRATGVWVHGWLQSAGGTGFGDNPKGAWVERTVSAASAFRTAVESLGPVPAWWSCLWHQSLSKASALARSLTDVRLAYVGTEHSLNLVPVTTQSGRPLPVGGRVDLMFSDRRPSPGGDLSGATVLVVDIKTGNDKPLTPKRMAAGEGIQLGIYGLRTRLAHASSTDLCTLKAGDPVSSQMNAAECEDLSHLWDGLSFMLEKGAFGQLETVRDEFGYAPELPLATLPIPTGILTQRRENLLRLS